MKPYSKIVVTTDLSNASRCAFDHASMLAKDSDASVEILYVYEDATMDNAGVFPGKAVLAASGVYSKDESELKNELEEICQKYFSQSKVDAKILKSGKSPASAIVEYLESSKASIAIISSNGRKGIKRAFLGSVAEEVARLSPCPVLIVKASDC